MTVEQVQCLLEFLGYAPGSIDGADGRNTQAAVRRFQQQEGLTVDGIAGSKTQTALREAVFQGRVYVPPDSEKADTGAQDGSGAGYGAEVYLQADGFYHIPRGVDVQITKNFWAHEIHCQGVGCCTESVISKRIMDLAQEIRDDLGEPLTIGTSGGSGYRCKAHNAVTPGASPTSLHTISEAVDLHYRDPDKLKAVVLRRLKDGEVGLYKWGCHVGCWDRGYVNKFFK